MRAGRLNATDFGIRKNTADAPGGVRQNGILAIGDSFVAGSEANDDEAWPAQLETRWYTDDNNRFYQAPVSNDAIGCALTKEIKKQADTMGYRVLYMMQYGVRQVSVGKKSDLAETFEKCAQAAGLRVVDDFDALLAIAGQGTAAFGTNI